MTAYLWVAFGSALGGMARYGFGLLAVRFWGETFPWGTIVINVLGSFVIGFFGALTMANAVLPVSPNLRTFVMVGICGGFTTFSSFSLQTLSLARDGNWFGATGNVAISVVLCLLAVTLGQVSADRIGFAGAADTAGPRRIVAIMDRTETARPVLVASAFAATLLGADQSGAVMIEALHSRHDVMDDTMPTEEVMTGARRQEPDGQAAHRSAELRSLFETWRQAGGVAMWRELAGETARVIMQEAARADLIVIGRSARGGAGAQKILHAALFDAGRLTLLVPAVVPSMLGRHVAIAWKPSEAADRVVRAALPLLLRADQVIVLIGTEEGAHDTQPTSLLQDLAAAGVRPVVRHFQASGCPIGKALLAQARLAGADLLVMGAYTHNRFVEMAVGGATRDILASADLPVLLHH